MNVLITGGYGFIGSHVAERFYKEGHTVSIIDNLVSGSCSNLNFEHKLYKISAEDKLCEDVFTVNNFDVVIHLAAKYSNHDFDKIDYKDTASNLMGLINIMSLSRKHSVSKFIFASSPIACEDSCQASLDQDSSSSMISDEISELIAELYRQELLENLGLNAIQLQIANTYGPRQKIIGEAEIVTEYMEQVFGNQELTVFGDGNQIRDIIYVEDVADAVYRCAQSDLCGVINVSTGDGVSINNIIHALSIHSKIKGILYKDTRNAEKPRQLLDNSRLQKELGWAPMHSLEEGMKKTFDWYAALCENSSGKADDSTDLKQAEKVQGKLTDNKKPFYENLIGFLIVIIIERILSTGGSNNFIDPKLVYIILMGIVYGTKQAMIAVVLSSGLQAVSIGLKGIPLSLLSSPNGLLLIINYLFIGFVVGYAIDLKNRSIKSCEIKIELLEERFKFVSDIYTETKDIKDKLQKQIKTSEDSFGKTYSLIKELDTLDPETIFSSAIQMLERIMKTKSIAFYVMNRNPRFARLVAHSSSLFSQIPKSLMAENSSALQYVLDSHEIFVNKDLDASLPMMMAPITDNGRIVAIVSLQDMDFYSLDLHHQNLLKIASNLISSFLSKACRYREATYSNRYISGTSILNEGSFEKLHRIWKQAKERRLADCALLEIGTILPIDHLEYEISSAIRELDYIGMGKDAILLVLLTNTSEKEAAVVIKRLKDKEITAFLSEDNNSPVGVDLIA